MRMDSRLGLNELEALFVQKDWRSGFSVREAVGAEADIARDEPVFSDVSCLAIGMSSR